MNRSMELRLSLLTAALWWREPLVGESCRLIDPNGS